MSAYAKVVSVSAYRSIFNLIISEFTMKQAPSNEYEKLGEVTVKGKNELVSIYTIPKINLDFKSLSTNFL